MNESIEKEKNTKDSNHERNAHREKNEIDHIP